MVSIVTNFYIIGVKYVFKTNEENEKHIPFILSKRISSIPHPDFFHQKNIGLFMEFYLVALDHKDVIIILKSISSSNIVYIKSKFILHLRLIICGITRCFLS